ncbi:MAG: LPP20 family lipoprotein [Tenuifilaceae bacterium]
MKNILVVTLLLAVITANAQQTSNSVPDWYGNPPVSNKKFYGVGVGTSKSMEIAEKKAKLEANLQLAEQVEPAKVKEIKTKTKSADGKIIEETIIREIVNTSLSGVTQVKKVVTQKDDLYTIYVLVEMKKKR